MRTYPWMPDGWTIEGTWIEPGKWWSLLHSPSIDASVNRTYKIIKRKTYNLGFVDPDNQEKLKYAILELIKDAQLQDFNFKKVDDEKIDKEN